MRLCESGEVIQGGTFQAGNSSCSNLEKVKPTGFRISVQTNSLAMSFDHSGMTPIPSGDGVPFAGLLSICRIAAGGRAPVSDFDVSVACRP